MPDPISVATLAATVVQIISPLIVEAAKAGAGEAGKALVKSANGSITALWDKVRAELAGRGESRAIERYEATPTDPGRRGGLEYALEGALEADPELRAEVERLVAQASTRLETGAQHLTVIGNGNVGAQVAGANNQVHIQHGGPAT